MSRSALIQRAKKAIERLCGEWRKYLADPNARRIAGEITSKVLRQRLAIFTAADLSKTR